MIKRNTDWLNRELSKWVAKGWITREAQQHIREHYGGSTVSTGRFILPLYMVCAVAGLAMLGIGLIWAAAYGWYHVDLSVRMVLSILLMLLAEGAVGAAVLQEKQGKLMGECIAVFHCAAVFSAVALVVQAFYIGWNISSYLLVCCFLILPAIYLLRSLGAAIWYGLFALYWAAQPGVVNTWGGAWLVWGLIALLVPFYLTLMQHRDEKKLSLFSWMFLLAGYAAFWLTVYEAQYVPLLLFSLIAVITMMAGYSIDYRKNWGKPLRCLGRMAAALALIAAGMSSSWVDLSRIASVHFLGWAAVVLLFILMFVIYGRYVKKRLWSPTVYGLIPFLMLFQIFLVRSGVHVSFPASFAACYALGVAAFEIAKGLRDGDIHFVDWGIILLFCFGAVRFADSGLSQLLVILAVAVLIVFLWFTNLQLQQRHLETVRGGQRSRRHHAVVRPAAGRTERKAAASPTASPVAGTAPEGDAMGAELSEWMQSSLKKITIPAVPAQQREARDIPDGLPGEETKLAQAKTVIPKEVPSPAFVPPPVFHRPEEILQEVSHDQPASKKDSGRKAEQKPATSSPWASMPKPGKRAQHFTHSPWSQEGERKK